MAAKNGRRSPSRTQKHDEPGIGELLRDARERQGLTLEQLSSETKISQRRLAAIEGDKLAAVPPFYQRAEIRTYARAVHLDPEQLLARLERGPAPPVVSYGSPEPSLSRRTLSPYHLALIASGCVLTAIVFWRAVPRDPPPVVQTGSGSVPDSTQPSLSPPGPSATSAAGAEPTESDRHAEPPASAGPPPARTETAAAGPAAAPNDGLPAAAPPDPRPAVESATELVVTTEPGGARVTVDGIGWGMTPVTIRYLTPGSKRIRVSKDGYLTTERVVSVDEGRRKTAAIPLQEITATR